MRTLRRHLQFERLQDAPIPQHVTATHVLSGEAVRLASGDTVCAVTASAAISGVLPAVAWGGDELVDGGVADNNTALERHRAQGRHDLRAADGHRVRADRGTPRRSR